MRKMLLHPLVVFSAVWGSVFLLYSLHWSELQDPKLADGLKFLVLSLAILAFVSLVFFLFVRKMEAPVPNNSNQKEFDRDFLLRLKLGKWVKAWVLLTIVEIIFSGGIPIVWSFTGSSKTYFDFGIPTLHGFLNSLISSISLIYFYRYLRTGDRRSLFCALWVVVWGFLVITRQLIIVNLLQFILLTLTVNRIKFTSILKVIVGFVAFILVFGWLGDIRTGADKFIGVALPSDNYPDFLPSGALWVYMYMVTPLMNLIYTINSSCGCESWYFGNTIAPLLPSVLRVLVVPSDNLEKGDVISQAFNVSTAFVDSYVDLGYLGIGIFVFFIAFACVYFWHKRDIRGTLIFVVLSQALVLTIFYNHFFSLPVITQIFWIYKIVKSKASRHSSLV